MLFSLMCKSCEYMKNITDPFMDLEFYIVGEYGYTAVAIYNIIYAIFIGVITFASVYIVVPCLCAFIILCICSLCVEIYEKITNTYTLVNNIVYGIKNDMKLFFDGIFVTLLFIYCFRHFFISH
jgi:hypothetical protein